MIRDSNAQDTTTRGQTTLSGATESVRHVSNAESKERQTQSYGINHMIQMRSTTHLFMGVLPERSTVRAIKRLTVMRMTKHESDGLHEASDEQTSH